jgi:hypothetical protein
VALLLMATVTVAVAPAARVPLVAERVIQACPLLADQLKVPPPVFCRVYSLLAGLKGPPLFPEEVKVSTGVTVRTGGVIT